MNRRERGYSMVKVMAWLVIAGTAIWQGFQILHIHQIYWRVEDVFEGITRNMAVASESDIRQKLPTLLKVQFVSRSDLPEEFYDNLFIKSEDGKIEIYSIYHATAWPLGRVKKVDEYGTYVPEELSGMDILRDRARLDFEFEPYAATP